jgi:hypothetical protein
MDLAYYLMLLCFFTLMSLATHWHIQTQMKALQDDIRRLAERMQELVDQYNDNEIDDAVKPPPSTAADTAFAAVPIDTRHSGPTT